MIKHITECTRLVVVCASVKWAATHVCCVCGCYTDDTPMVPDDSGCVHHIWMTKQPTHNIRSLTRCRPGGGRRGNFTVGKTVWAYMCVATGREAAMQATTREI